MLEHRCSRNVLKVFDEISKERCNDNSKKCNFETIFKHACISPTQEEKVNDCLSNSVMMKIKSKLMSKTATQFKFDKSSILHLITFYILNIRETRSYFHMFFEHNNQN